MSRSVALTDLGPYTCQAYNGGGSPASHSVVMQVYGPVYPAPGEQKYMRYVASCTTPPAPAGLRKMGKMGKNLPGQSQISWTV